jgi:hypothetical protein
MAGDEPGDIVAGDGAGHGPSGSRLSNPLRQLLVREYFSWRYGEQGTPHLELKIGAGRL